MTSDGVNRCGSRSNRFFLSKMYKLLVQKGSINRFSAPFQLVMSLSKREVNSCNQFRANGCIVIVIMSFSSNHAMALNQTQCQSTKLEEDANWER